MGGSNKDEARSLGGRLGLVLGDCLVSARLVGCYLLFMLDRVESVKSYKILWLENRSANYSQREMIIEPIVEIV